MRTEALLYEWSCRVSIFIVFLFESASIDVQLFKVLSLDDAVPETDKGRFDVILWGDPEDKTGSNILADKAVAIELSNDFTNLKYEIHPVDICNTT